MPQWHGAGRTLRRAAAASGAVTSGHPYGGACLPKDTRGFLGFAGELGVEMPLLSGVIKVNEILEEMSNAEMVGESEIDLREDALAESNGNAQKSAA